MNKTPSKILVLTTLLALVGAFCIVPLAIAGQPSPHFSIVLPGLSIYFGNGDDAGGGGSGPTPQDQDSECGDRPNDCDGDSDGEPPVIHPPW